MLYVPASRTKFLEQSFARPTDNITYDLEDSVVPSAKEVARARLVEFLKSSPRAPQVRSGDRHLELAVRINDISTQWAIDDIKAAVSSPFIDAIVIPKVNSASDLIVAAQAINSFAPHRLTGEKDPKAKHDAEPLPRLKILALIESARAVMDIGSITKAYQKLSEEGKPSPILAGLMFAAEDFALDVGITRSPQLTEMLYARSAVVTAAKAAGLESAIDLVCTAYGPENAKGLKQEAENGRAMGFTGKQCIHPTQLETVNKAFAPSKEAVEWAVRVLIGNEKAEEFGLGAWNLDGSMIDAPVVGKAKSTWEMAEKCGMDKHVKQMMKKHKDQKPG